MKVYIYWIWGMSNTGIVYANNENEAREKITTFYNLTINESDLCFEIDTLEKKIFLEYVKENDDVIEVYEG